MGKNEIGSFKGFSVNTLDFLINLKLNNSKSWFEENKKQYNEFLLEPMRALISELSPFMLSIDSLIETRPAVGKTISRINRDTRFSNDKSLYRDRMWMTFRRPAQEWQGAPAFFFEISPDYYTYGMGYYLADKATMDNLRKMIDEKPEKFENAIAFYYKQKSFVLEGEKYKRVLNPGKDERVLDWYQRKNLYLITSRKIDSTVFSGKLVDLLISDFSLIADFYHFLYSIKV